MIFRHGYFTFFVLKNTLNSRRVFLDKVIKLLHPLDSAIKQSQQDNATLDTTLFVLQALKEAYKPQAKDDCEEEAFKDAVNKELDSRLVKNGLTCLHFIAYFLNPTVKKMRKFQDVKLGSMTIKNKNYPHKELKIKKVHSFDDVLFKLVKFECMKTITDDEMRSESEEKQVRVLFLLFVNRSPD